jgi:hypothetical protein
VTSAGQAAPEMATSLALPAQTLLAKSGLVDVTVMDMVLGSILRISFGRNSRIRVTAGFDNYLRRCSPFLLYFFETQCYGNFFCINGQNLEGVNVSVLTKFLKKFLEKFPAEKTIHKINSWRHSTRRPR